MNSPQPYVQLAVEVDAAAVEALEPLLEEAGALSISYLDPGGEPILEPSLGSTPLWSRLRLLALFQGWPDADRLYADACQVLGVGRLEGWQLEVLEQRCWERAWMDHYHPMQFGERFWVCPTHCEPPDPDAVNLRLDPGLAFGTGTHATTALCLEWLAEQALSGQRVVDFGCGSGILAIAGLLLGAEHAYGIDNDPQALYASDENARRNGVGERLTLWAPEQVQPLAADVVLANILAGVLIELAPNIVALARPGAALVLSGVLERQAQEVMDAYRDHVVWETPRVRDGWCLLVGRKR